MKLKAAELRASTPTEQDLKLIKRNEIYIILDNVLDTYNVGAIFRLADAVGAKKVFLCGDTEVPPNSRIKKASVNTWQWTDWEYTSTTIEAIEILRKKVSNITVVAVEQDAKSVKFEKFDYKLPIALIAGNETSGISEDVLKMCDVIVELPMFGINTSLNVMVSLGIVLYKVVEQTQIL
ncbi:MAG: TrmH family RNA methyltransferase [Candidatus Woesearchaeota archaeon]|nr:TrmH family RNA methyltransferase [Candidatus Woesearchaeota archaeon]